jgi:hypothetical protein
MGTHLRALRPHALALNRVSDVPLGGLLLDAVF